MHCRQRRRQIQIIASVQAAGSGASNWTGVTGCFCGFDLDTACLLIAFVNDTRASDDEQDALHNAQHVAKEELDVIDLRQRLEYSTAPSGTYHSLPLLEKKGIASISRLPVSLRILLESVLRNLDGRRIRDEDVEALARWQPNAERDGGGAVRRRSRAATGLHRRAASRRSRRDALCGGAARR